MESVSVYEPSTSNTENLASSRGRASFSGRRKHHRRQQANRPLSDDAGHDSLCDSSEVSGNLRGNHSSRRNFKRKPHYAGSTSRMPQANHGSSGATEDQPVADNCGEQAIVADQQSGVSQRGNHSMRRNSRRKPHNASSTNRHAQSDMATLALNPQNSNTNNQSRNPDLSRNGFMFNPNARPFLPSPQNQYRNKNKNSARSELQNDDKDITQPSSQRRISRNSATFRGASSVRRGGQRRINNNEDAQCLRESLTTQLENETYECMICFQTILCQQSIWSCKTCFRMFHISGGCITDWAKKSREDDHKWRCPMCQTKSEQIPYNYYCFCGKKRNPRMIVGEIPHSCGRICGGQRGVGCPHPCSEPCHPGPCPECPVMMTRKCCCGSTEKAIRCGTGFNVTCENKCGKTLSCGEHACEKTCHTGDCDRCEILVSYSCFCGDNTKEFVCDEAAVGKVGFSCEEDCSGLYKCGKHRCAKKCHTKALDCGPCPADPSRIISCPCGKCMQEELGPKRVNCSDPILTCASICNKVLPCGEQGKSHRCKSLCHNGPCPPCTMSTLVTCRCNSEKITLTCDKYLKILEGDGLFICERKCKKRKSCGHHRCQELCCTQTEHLCVQVCGKRLSCGLHHCENLCHPGQCQRCLNASFDEQFCHCGRTMRPPPVPCGTPLPVCDQPCARRHSCDHQVMHPCHSDQSCPPCAFLVDRPCYGKHEVRKNIPCYLDSVSCGRVCGLSLSCDVHNCARNCHSGDCSENGVKCTRPCPVLRRPCEHPCARPCHPGEGCPPSLCTHLVQIMCDCGRRKEMVKCCEAEKSMTLLRALRVNDHEENPGLLCDVSRNTLTRSSSMEQLSCLSCNDDCKKVARNKLLADALSIVTNDDGDTDSPTVTFTETLKAEFKSSSQFVAEVEAVFIALLDTLSDATNTNAMSHHFRPMPLEKRRFLHEYGQFFQIETQSFDSPPQRSVVVTAKRGVSKTPLILLSDLHKYPSVLKAPGKTVLRSNINDEIKKAADAKAKLEGEEGGLKTIKSDRKVIRRAAPRIEAAKPLSQSNAFSLLCSDAEEAADEQESITPITSPERPYSIPTQKDADWWSDEEMQCDDVTWNILNKGQCSFKAWTKPKMFCRNEYNLTGVCNRASCPLSNSQYATVREENGICYLYMKVVERSHYPRRLWEKVKLSRDMTNAVEQISDNLLHWSEFVRQKCKARLVRIHQYLIRMRKMAIKGTQKKLITIPRKTERRETRREEKALVAAKLDNAIEKELLARLKQGTYGDMYNFNKAAFDKLIDESEKEKEMEIEQEIEDDEDTGRREYVADFDSSEDEGDMEDGGHWSPPDTDSDEDEWQRHSEDEEMDNEDNTTDDDKSDEPPTKKSKMNKKLGVTKKSKKVLRKKRPQVEIEYEEETEPVKKIRA